MLAWTRRVAVSLGLLLGMVAVADASAATRVYSPDRVYVIVESDTASRLAFAVEDEGLAVRSLDGQPLAVEEPCVVSGSRAHCPGLTYTTVRGSEGNDEFHAAASIGKLEFYGRGGNDRVKTAQPDINLLGGRGEDAVDYSSSEKPANLSLVSGFESPSAFGVYDIENVTATRFADRIDSRRSHVKVLDAGPGDDVLFMRDGTPNEIRCGGDPGDYVNVDDEGDVPVGCAGIDPPPPIDALPPAVDAQWQAMGLDASPSYLAGALRLWVRGAEGSSADGTVSLSRWQDHSPVAELPSVAAAAPVDGRMQFDAPLPPEVRAVLVAQGRLRAHVRLRVRHRRRPEDLLEGRFTLVALPSWRGTLNGRAMRGSFGAQRLVGSPLGDLLSGASADDTLLGGDGADRLVGGTGNDLLDGGAAGDRLDGSDGDDRLVGGPGDDHLRESRFGDDLLDGGDGDDILLGLRGRDVLRGGSGDDVLDGGSGPDEIDCGPREDIAFVNNARDRAQLRDCEEVHEGLGVDTRACSEGGTGSAETLLGTETADVCLAGAGADDLEGRGGDDVLDGGGDADRLFGRFGTDRLRGGAGNDELEGGRGPDVLLGGDGDDRLNGGYDPDVVRAGAGDDRVIGRGGGRDRIDCGAGTDVAHVDSEDIVRNCERVARSGTRA